MASKQSVRSLQALTRRSRRCCVCANSTKSVAPVRQFSTTSKRAEESYESRSTERPRWSYTPEQMKAPFHPRIKDPRKAFESNDDPAKLDAMYIKLLGRGGDQVLTDEVKWLAVTHKSFDQGRRGFNDRLAFFGKQILYQQYNLALLHSTSHAAAPIQDPYDRVPYSHPALNGLPNLSSISMSQALAKERLGSLAASYGIGHVTRWKPRNPANLESSGSDVVFTTSLYAILGAIALQKGGEKANHVARETILKPLGIE